MGLNFISKMKDTANAAMSKAKEELEAARANYEQKKAEQEAHRLAMEAESVRYAEEITSAILSYDNNGGFFDGLTLDQLTGFTKEFYDKILMPANSVSQSKITMYPYIPEKQLQKFAVSVKGFAPGETTLVYLKAAGKQDIVITDQALYFVLALAEDPKFFAKGRVALSEISSFTVEKDENTYQFKCDEYVLASFMADKTTAEDFVTLNNYFQSISSRDFVITDEEVDALIQEKIGNTVYAEVKKYLVYDDELMVYFAWGINSLSAKDYIVCTTKQIIIVDREMLGATANVKQFYYEDITSASTEQNSTSSDFTTALLETAITAATKSCDLTISVAGARTRINTLYKVEAERVVAIYHQYRKAARVAAVQPQQVVVQQQADPFDQLKKLSEMKELGIITDEEFNQKKVELLAKIR